MSTRETQQIAIKGSDAAESCIGQLHSQRFASGERMGRALKVLAVCLLLAVVTAFIPIAHFFLVPLFLIAGPVLAVITVRSTEEAIAIANDTFYVVGQEYIFQFSTTTWGWIHLILGIVILLAGFYLFTGAVWARTVGVIIAVLWALVAFAWLPWYPVWAIVFIAVSIFVIWALTAHGRDIVEA